MKNKAKLTDLAFVINGFVFLLGGSLLLEEGKSIMALIQWLAFLLNLAMVLKFWKRRVMERLSYSILFMNVVACLSMAIDAIISGKSFIQYAWILAALISIIALVIHYRNRQIGEERLHSK